MDSFLCGMAPISWSAAQAENGQMKRISKQGVQKNGQDVLNYFPTRNLCSESQLRF